MSNNIERNVVEMVFDNKKFEKNVETTTKSVDKLKGNLNFEQTGKSLRNFERTANDLNFQGLAHAADQVGAKFSLMQVAAYTAMSNIVNKAVDAGERLVRSLSVEQIAEGWNKFDEKTTGVQTIMSATGKSIDEVSAQLDKLNWFTDETSFNFTDMVSNIGKFTSNNVDLETSVTAMQGIATWAALSGQNAGEAGRAMYNLSQAISLGKVTLMDWKSIQNANMATTEFKQTAIDTAVELGTLTKVSEGLYKTIDGGEVSVTNFNEELSRGWFNSDVLLKTLDKYGQFSNELRTYTEEFDLSATQLLRAMEDYKGTDESLNELINEYDIGADKVEAFANALNVLGKEEFKLGQKSFRAAQTAKTWQEVIDATKDAVSTGWMNTFEQLFGNYEEAKDLWSQVVDDFYNIFAVGGETRNEILEAWHSKEVGGYQAFVDTFLNLLTLLKEVKFAISDGLKPFRVLMGYNEELDNPNEGIAVWLKNVIDKIKALIPTGEALVNLTDKVRSVVYKFSEAIVNLRSFLKNFFDPVRNTIKETLKGFATVGGIISKSVDALHAFFDSIKERGKPSERTLETIRTILHAIWNSILFVKNTVVALFTILRPIFDFTVKVVSYLFSKIGKIVGLFGNGVEQVNNSFLSLASGKPQALAKRIGDFLDRLENRIKSIRDLVKNSKAYQIFAAALSTVATGVKDTFTNLSSGVGKSLSFLEKVKNVFSKFGPIVEALKKIFQGVWNFIKPIALALWDLLKKMFSIIGNLIMEIGERLKNLDFTDFKELAKGGVLVSIIALVNKIKDGFSGLGKVFGKEGGLVKLFGEDGSLAGIFDTLSGCLESLQNNIKAKTLTTIATAIAILAASVFVLSTIDNKKLVSSTEALLVLFAGLKLMSNSLSKGEGIKRDTAKSLQTTAISLLILSFALRSIASIDSEKLMDATIALGSIFAFLTAYGKIMQTSKKQSSKATSGLISFAVAILIISKALQQIAKIDSEKLWQSVLAMEILLVSVAGFMMLTKVGGKSSANGLISLGIAILLLTAAVKSFSKLSWTDLVKGLAGVVVLLFAVAAAVKLLPKSTVLKTAGLISLSLALLILAGTLRILAKISWSDLIKSLGTVIVLLASLVAAINLLPKTTLLKSAGLMTVALTLLVLAGVLKIISKMSWGDLIKGITTLTLTLAVVTASLVILSKFSGPLLLLGIAMTLIGVGVLSVSVALIALAGSLDVLAGSIGLIIKILIDSIIALIVAIPDMITALAISLKNSFASIVDLVVTIVAVLLSALKQLVPEIVDTIWVILESVLKFLGEKVPVIVGYILEMILGIIRSLAKYVPDIIVELFGLIKAIVRSVNEVFKDMNILEIVSATAWTTALIGLMALFAVLATEGIVVGALLVLMAVELRLFARTLQPFWDSLSSIDPMALVAAKILSEVILAFTVSSVLNGISRFLSFGANNSFANFGKELAAFGPYMRKYGDSVRGLNTEMVTASATAVKTLVEVARLVPYRGGLTSLLIGENSLAGFGDELVTFGASIAQYSNQIKGIDPEAVTASATAATSLIKMADLVPYRGGLVSLFVGENSLAGFGDELKAFGEAMASYSSSIVDVDPEMVKSTAIAAQSLVEMANNVPNEGGLKAWFEGDNRLADFAPQLVVFAESMSEFQKKAPAITEDTLKNIQNVASAGTAIMKMATNVPNQGGLIALFEGDNNLAKIGPQLEPFAEGISGFSQKVGGFKKAQFEQVEFATKAGSLILNAMNLLEKEGGVVSWFTGAKEDMETLKVELPIFAEAVVAFKDKVKGFKKAQMDQVTWAAQASGTLIQAFNSIGTEGGFFEIFSGHRINMGDFAKEIEQFADGVVRYSNKIQAANLTGEGVSHSVEMGERLIGMANMMGNEGGIFSWFEGNKKTLSTFGQEIVAWGGFLNTYVTNAAGFTQMHLTYIRNTVDAGMSILSLAEMMTKDGGIIANFFDGKQKTLNQFGEEIVDYSDYISTYAKNVEGFTKSFGIKNSVWAGEQVLEIAERMIKTGGLTALFEGEQMTLTAFGKDAAEFGKQIMLFANNVEDFPSTKYAKRANVVAKDLLVPLFGLVSSSEMDSAKIWAFINSIAPFGKAIHDYVSAVDGLEGNESVDISATLADSIVSAVGKYTDQIVAISNTGIQKFNDSQVEALKDAIIRIQDIIESDDFTPVITPVVDMSNVERAAGDISRIFSGSIKTTTQNASETGGIVKRRGESVKTGGVSDFKNQQSQSGSVNYTQNIYTNKSPSRIDIYRDTQMLLSR